MIRSKDKPLSSNISNTDPAYKIVNGIGVAQIDVEMVLKTAEPMDETEAARVSAGLVNEFVLNQMLFGRIIRLTLACG